MQLGAPLYCHPSLSIRASDFREKFKLSSTSYAQIILLKGFLPGGHLNLQGEPGNETGIFFLSHKWKASIICPGRRG